MAAPVAHHRFENNPIILFIAFFKLVKCGLLIAGAVAAFRLVHRDLQEVIFKWAHALNLDVHRRVVQAFVERALKLTPPRLELLGGALLFYAAVFLTEGVGLLTRQRWAHYFTIFVTSSFLPLELFETLKQFSVLKLFTLVLNAGIVAYLLIRIRRLERLNLMPGSHQPSAQPEPHKPAAMK